MVRFFFFFRWILPNSLFSLLAVLSGLYKYSMNFEHNFIALPNRTTKNVAVYLSVKFVCVCIFCVSVHVVFSPHRSPRRSSVGLPFCRSVVVSVCVHEQQNTRHIRVWSSRYVTYRLDTFTYTDCFTSALVCVCVNVLFVVDICFDSIWIEVNKAAATFYECYTTSNYLNGKKNVKWEQKKESSEHSFL